ncbi:MAG: DUF1284 domain-containing protein [Roseovarius sp.]|nr:DUF1284 domain-containing protein [Roseovarius sp.]
MTSAPLRYRPHHFLCSLGFAGEGYSSGFTANMARIVDGTLRAPGGDDTVIEVVGATDDICAPCPKRRGILCESQRKIDRLDARHARALGLFVGAQLSWGEAQARIVRHVPSGALSDLCKGCQWLELGHCENALSRLHESHSADTAPKAAGSTTG